jgi:hypothetical protein
MWSFSRLGRSGIGATPLRTQHVLPDPAHHDLLPLKDEAAEHPVAAAWRPTFHQIVRAFTRQDYQLADRIESVEPVSEEAALHIRSSIGAYGATLVELTEDTWRTSVARWMGSHWEVLVDLQTAEEGRSDLVLGARIRETERGYSFEVSMVYVP